MSVTMLALARFTLKGPYRAATVVTLLTLISAFVVPVTGMTTISLMLALMTNLMAAILVGLIILTQGLELGIKVIAAAMVAVGVVVWQASASPELRLVTLLLQWVPIIILAQSLRSSNSLALTLLVGIAIGVVFILLQNVYWTQLEAGWFSELMQRPEGRPSNQSDALQQAQFVQMVMLLLVSSMYLMHLMVIFIARWLQAKLDQGNSFRREFCALVLGKPAAIIALGAISAGMLLQYMWLLSFALLLVFAFMFQGIAILHSWLRAKNQPVVMFVLYYILLVFIWQITGVLTSILGMVDNWVGFKRNPDNPNSVN